MTFRSLLARSIQPHNRWGDTVHAFRHFRYHNGYWPNIWRPTTFNEHLLSLKLNRLDSETRRSITDKYRAKLHIASELGDAYIPRTLSVLSSHEDVDNYCFPERCVVKPTHASGLVLFKRQASDRLPLNEIKSWLDIDYYRQTRERNYLGLEPRIIVEEYIDFEGNKAPDDYKIFCFFGIPKLILVDTNRFSDHGRAFYTADWERLPFPQGRYSPAPAQKPPPNLRSMLRIAKRLAKVVDPIRIDMYTDGSSILVGEMTNCHGNAHMTIAPTADRALGQLFVDPACEPSELLESAYADCGVV